VPFLITTQHWKALRTLCELSSSSVSFIGKISRNFNLKNMISTYTQAFYHGENGPNSPDFEERNFQIARF
jgi:hypothetical protein